MSTPLLSVIVPVYNGGSVLPRCLEALRHSDLPRPLWELIVVDDASTDATPEIAAAQADVVVRLPGRPHGPAYVRNRGSEVARGQILVFVDADVCIHPDALRRFAQVFAANPDVSAVFGSYDDSPPAPGIVSKYRNLLHYWVHQQHAGDAETFWAGCGAVRADVFREAGMYDEWRYTRPQIEDIELGQRIRALGHRILLCPEIQGTHLKQWTLRNVISTDLNDRGVPWMRLLVEHGMVSTKETLNLRQVERINTALVGLATLALLAAIGWREPWLLLLALALALPVIYTNRRFYDFFRRRQGLWFALKVLPLHLAYYVVNGFSATIGWLLHHVVGEPAPAASVQAFAETGLQSWPPVPRRIQPKRRASDKSPSVKA